MKKGEEKEKNNLGLDGYENGFTQPLQSMLEKCSKIGKNAKTRGE
jgi:hypothetical protein